MHKQIVYKLVAVAIGLILAGAFMLCDLGVNLTPMTKLFVIFFGGVIGFQSAPAAVLFISMVRGGFKVNQQNSLTEME